MPASGLRLAAACLGCATATAPLPLDHVRERLGEQQRPPPRSAAPARSRRCARDEGRAAPGPDELVRGEERGLHGAPTFAGPAPSPPRPSAGERAVVQAQVAGARRRASPRPGSRAPARRARRRASSGAGRRGGPARTPARRRRPATSAQARCSSSTVVSTPLPMLKTPPRGPPPRAARRRRRRRRRSRGPAARRRRSRSARRGAIRSRKIETTPPSRPGVLPRPVDVPRSARRRAGAVDAVPAEQILLAAELRDPVRRAAARAARPRSRARRTRRRSHRRST